MKRKKNPYFKIRYSKEPRYSIVEEDLLLTKKRRREDFKPRRLKRSD